ncbi:MAG: FMN-binding negative transcriptional regulator [Pseudomonadales bacterium]|nr:FMN-binding negative transcriptional regulator [Pseudomonadales bacterium]
MYIPKHFEVTDATEVDRFIEANDFGILVSQVDEKSFATHIPFSRPETNRLEAHIAKANPQWQQLDGQEVLVIFAGSHGYVSPGWIGGIGVPTWNYQAVHVYGRATHFDDVDRLNQLVTQLSSRHETSMESPWTPEFDARMLNAIIGIDIEIDKIECKYKLSQHRPLEERETTISKLDQLGNQQLADAMRDQLPR